MNCTSRTLFNDDPIVLKPGMSCIEQQYNTKDRDDFTDGGESTLEEMCLNFLYYYNSQGRYTNLSK